MERIDSKLNWLFGALRLALHWKSIKVRNKFFNHLKDKVVMLNTFAY